MKEIFESKISDNIKGKPDLASKINATYKFTVTGEDSGSWVIDLKTEGGDVRASEEDADCTITIKDTDLVDLMTGKLNGQTAFMMGKLKVAGNMGLAMKLNSILS